jgi:predicted Zn finger-like uncharacterized protein
MDVTCNHCGAEYEFEETLISDRGTTVKCTACGHLFKIFHTRPPSDKSLDTKPWLVRKSNGLIEPLESLGELTRLIAKGQYTEDDEISRTSQVWKRLGDIAELQPFFQMSRRRSEPPKRKSEAPTALPDKSAASPTPPYRLPTGVRSSEPPPQREQLPQSPPRKIETKATVQQPRQRTDTPTIRNSSSPTSGDIKRDTGETINQDPLSYSRSRQRKLVQIVENLGKDKPEDAETGHVERKSPDNRDSENPTTRLPALPNASGAEKSGREKRLVTPNAATVPTVINSTIDAKSEKRRQSPLHIDTNDRIARRPKPGIIIYIGVIFTISIGAVVWLRWPSQIFPRSKPIVVKPIQETSQKQWLERIDALLANCRLDQFADFVDTVTKERVDERRDKALLVSLSRLNAVWAQAIRFKLFERHFFEKELATEKKKDGVAFEDQLPIISERAKRHAEEALQVDRADPDAQIALSDALRLTGDVATARITLENVLFALGEPSMEFLRVSALLAIDEMHEDYATGLELAKQAVNKNPQVTRNRFLLAYCHLAANETEGAQSQIDAILKTHPDHPEALELARLIAAAKKLLEQTPDASVEEDKKPETLAPEANADIKPAGETAQKKPDLSEAQMFQEYIEQGEKALENGSIRHAQRMFEKALAQRPDFPRAQNGMAYVELENGRVSSAIRLFKNAVESGYPEANIGLGDAYRQVGRNAEALSAYQTYVRVLPHGRLISVAARQIERLTEGSPTTGQKDEASETKSQDTTEKSEPSKDDNPK